MNLTIIYAHKRGHSHVKNHVIWANYNENVPKERDSCTPDTRLSPVRSFRWSTRQSWVALLSADPYELFTLNESTQILPCL